MAAATLSAASPVAAASPRPGAHERPGPGEGAWPDGRLGAFHLLDDAAVGACTRHDLDVGGAGPCGEVGLAMEIPFEWAGHYWHVGATLGVGGMPSVTSGDLDLGVSRSSGGGYALARALLGFDATRYFFAEGGVQTRLTWSLRRVTPGVQGVVDLGTRVGDQWELGMRGLLGVDGVTAAAGSERAWGSAVAWGTTVFARLLFR